MQELSIRERILEFIKTLPEVDSVKAYGSSIAYQSGYKANEKKQVDLIVIVEDIKKFYEENLKKNKYMYKMTPKFYFKHASKEKLKKAAAICYTTDIKYGIDTYKMGVIEKEDVLDDLLNWKTFYIAGRFQKEMYTAVKDEDIEKANEINKRNALTIALILLDKEKPKLIDLYEQICSLSYMGDSRKTFKAEDPNKIKKLASGSKEHFNKEFRDKTYLFTTDKDEYIKIDYSKVYDMIKFLPDNLKERITNAVGGDKVENKVPEVRETIKDYLTEIIKGSSSGQTKKGILTTGPKNSISYALSKLKKGRKKS
jgi:translocator assembly and maintenance protein 41